MREQTNYIGITIGPIFDTIRPVTAPAALWAASYTFSYISKQICDKLAARGVPAEDFIIPCMPVGNDVQDAFDEGVGIFPDRIIFKSGAVTLDDVNAVRAEIIADVTEKFIAPEYRDSDYLQQYLLIDAVAFACGDGDNPILTCSRMLDSVELSKPMVCREERNPLLDTFTDNDRAKAIITDALAIRRSQLLRKDGGIKSVQNIAAAEGSNKGKKAGEYYALLYADVDNMGEVIKTLQGDAFAAFSRLCMQYNIKAKELVRKYHGVTVYAGGDDLLAMLPCLVEDQKTVFDFSHELNAAFTDVFAAQIQKMQAAGLKPPSLSVGVFISYHKFPLYEALAQTQQLLFCTAKQQKNCVAVQLTKHAGQSAGLIIPHAQLADYLALQSRVLAHSDTEDEDRFLLSAAQKIAQFSTLFNLADDNSIAAVFDNTFDNEAQKQFDLSDLVTYYRQSGGIRCIDENGDTTGEKARMLEATLRMIKFFTEKGGNNA